MSLTSGGPAPHAAAAKKFVETPDPVRAMDWESSGKDEDQADWKIADAAIAQGRRAARKPFSSRSVSGCRMFRASSKMV
jgi:hypothetical protein